MYMDFTSELAWLAAHVARFAAMQQQRRERAAARRVGADRSPDDAWLLAALHKFECLGRAFLQGDPAEIMDACDALDDHYGNFPASGAALPRSAFQPDVLNEVQEICRRIRSKTALAQALGRQRAVPSLVAVPQILDPSSGVTEEDAAVCAHTQRIALLTGTIDEPCYLEHPGALFYRIAPPAWVTAGALPDADIEVRAAAVDMLLCRARVAGYTWRDAVLRTREYLFLRRSARAAALKLQQVASASPLHHAATVRILMTLPPSSQTRTLLSRLVGL